MFGPKQYYESFTDTTRIKWPKMLVHMRLQYGPCGEMDHGLILASDCGVVVPNVFNPNSTLDSNRVS